MQQRLWGVTASMLALTCLTVTGCGTVRSISQSSMTVSHLKTKIAPKTTRLLTKKTSEDEQSTKRHIRHSSEPSKSRIAQVSKPSHHLTIHLNSPIYMVSPNVGWDFTSHPGTLLLSDGVQRSTTSAHSWTNVTPATLTQTQNIFAGGTFLNAEDAWFVTTRPSMPLQNSQKSVHDSLVFRTDDGGKHWTIIRLHHSYLLAWIDFISPLQGWLLASPGPATGQEPCILYYTHDGGKHWRIISSTSDIDFSSQSKHSLPNWNGKTGISFLNSTTGWMTIDDGNKSGVITLYVTHDGGSRWSAQSIAVPKRWKAVYTHPLPPIFSSPTTGVMPVTFSGKNETMFYFTMDSGTHWTTSTPIPEARVLDVVMSNQTTVWTTNGKSVYATINDGDSWVKWTCPHHDKVISLFILKDGLSAIAYTEKKGKITQHQLYIHDMNSFLL